MTETLYGRCRSMQSICSDQKGEALSGNKQRIWIILILRTKFDVRSYMFYSFAQKLNMWKCLYKKHCMSLYTEMAVIFYNFVFVLWRTTLWAMNQCLAEQCVCDLMFNINSAQ